MKNQAVSLHQQALELLQNSKTLDQFKEIKDEFLDLMEEAMKHSVASVKEAMKLPEGEDRAASQNEAAEIERIMNEQNEESIRIFELDEVSEQYREETFNEIFERVGPAMEEMMDLLAQFMTGVVGEAMDAMGEVVGGVAEAMGASMNEDEIEVEDEFVYDSRNPDTPAMLYNLYTSRSLGDLEENKAALLKAVEEEMQYCNGELDILTDMGMELYDDDHARIAKMQHQMERLVPETDKEFSRIAGLPDAAEDAGKIKKELLDLIAPKIKEMEGYLAKVKKGA